MTGRFCLALAFALLCGLPASADDAPPAKARRPAAAASHKPAHSAREVVIPPMVVPGKATRPHVHYVVTKGGADAKPLPLVRDGAPGKDVEKATTGPGF